jgi:MoxR-vWA-beta-propeller ternary system domain bpX4
MSLTSFVAALLEHGRVQVPPPDEKNVEDHADDVGKLLSDRAQSLAIAFPGDPPPVEMTVALWAARQLYRASQLAVYRELDASSIDRLLREPCPPAPPAARHWSVDLTFVFLPDLMLLARSASEGDPLLARLGQWAADWPLSSVGAGDMGPRNIEEIADNAGLLRLYVDRIVAKKDWTRLKNSSVAAAIRRSLGAHLAEWPELARLLESQR